MDCKMRRSAGVLPDLVAAASMNGGHAAYAGIGRPEYAKHPGVAT